jgi:hypothetical protein
MGGESKKFSVCLSQLTNRRSPFAACAIFTVLLVHLFIGVTQGNDQDTFVLKKDGKINAQVDDRPLNQTLKELAAKISIDLKGISVGSETVSLSLSNASLEDVLKKMMRGYNYVLVKPGKSDRLTLMVLSRADRTKYVDSPAPALTAPPPVPQPIPQPVQQAVPIGPSQAQQAQRPSPGPQKSDSSQIPPISGGAKTAPQGSFPVPVMTGLSPEMFPPMPPDPGPQIILPPPPPDVPQPDPTPPKIPF